MHPVTEDLRTHEDFSGVKCARAMSGLRGRSQNAPEAARTRPEAARNCLRSYQTVSYTHLRAHETSAHL
eukprot:13300118-Alexandrium_andersonii.AAC.1